MEIKNPDVQCNGQNNWNVYPVVHMMIFP